MGGRAYADEEPFAVDLVLLQLLARQLLDELAVRDRQEGPGAVRAGRGHEGACVLEYGFVLAD